MNAVELDYAALTLDSNVFIGYGLNLERGLLGQLQQFLNSPVTLLISEVVLQEIRKHLMEATKLSRQKVQGALKSARSPFGISEAVASAFEANILGKYTDAEIVDARLETFVKATGAVIVKAGGTDIDRLLSLYFESDPPFEGSGDKKAEFPDAIALLSLENWAKVNGAQIIAVSKDAGWVGFAKSSMHIEAKENLADALTHFQPHYAARNIIEALQNQIVNGTESEILKTLNNFVVESTNEAEVDVEHSSAIHAELDQTEVHHKSHEFVLDESGLPIVDLIRIEANWLSLRLRVSIDYEVQAHFSMAVWDSIDREYISIGSSSAIADDSYVCDVMLSLTGDFSAGISETAVGELGIDLNLPGTDVGEVEPDMHDD